jgi:hypothetical protein
MFARPPTDVNSRAGQAIGTKPIMTTVFFTGCKLIVPCILPKGTRFNQSYFVDFFVPDLERKNVNFHCWIPQATF